MKNIFLAIITAFSLLMSGCSNAITEAEMPEIPFKVITYLCRDDLDENAEQGKRAIVFLDKSGNYYLSDYSEICFLSNEELIEALKSGDERITKLSITCDVDELRENYNKLAAVKNKCELAYPKELPAVEADSTTWYGLFYGEDGKLTNLPFHADERMTGIETNNDRANEVYEWYKSAAKKQ